MVPMRWLRVSGTTAIATITAAATSTAATPRRLAFISMTITTAHSPTNPPREYVVMMPSMVSTKATRNPIDSHRCLVSRARNQSSGRVMFRASAMSLLSAMNESGGYA